MNWSSRILIINFILYLILKPIYLLGDSPIQVADMLLIIGFALEYIIIAKNKPQRDYYINRSVLLFAIMMIYQFAVNFCAYCILGTQSYETFSLIKNNLYYVFNFIAILYIYYFYLIIGDSFKKMIAVGCTFSMVSVLAGLILNLGLTSRNSGFFNNPNQLGYYVLLMVTAAVILRSDISVLQRYFVWGVALLGCLLSGSKAAVIGVLVLLFFALGSCLVNKILNSGRQLFVVKKKTFFLTIIVIAFAIIFVNKNHDMIMKSIDSLLIRFSSDKAVTEGLGDTRGYSRIGEIGEFILTGVGEGAFGRFSVMTGNETHSSIATIIVSYGLIGVILMFSFLVNICRRQKRNIFRFIFAFCGVLVYSVSHNGLRNTVFWMLLIVFALSLMKEEEIVND